uniref:Uncharacterized protein n=1 Tax=Fadolivirus 2 TaxID=2740747 RepID=A0A7D3UR08_9VIRU|nr:hypothetical protein Fadolivirus_2_2 [Fadolivirus 2]
METFPGFVVDYGKISSLLGDAIPKDKILIMALYDILVNMCHYNPEEEFYYFEGIDEQVEFDNMLSWVEIIHKIAPFHSLNYVKQCQKKLLIVVKHLCKALEHKNIKMESKLVGVYKDKIKSTKTIYYIYGI